MQNKAKLNELKILSIGNSFSEDTMALTPQIALSLGFEKITFGNLYVGGCSIKQHYTHAKNNLPVYTYFENNGENWTATENTTIKTALLRKRWDWISIQHGTGDGSRHTSEDSYLELSPLLRYVKEFSSPDTKIAYNMTWVGEPDHPHHEILSYGGNQLLLYSKIMEFIQKIVLPNQMIDKIIPTGTAIQNVRTVINKRITRDGYHLSLGEGRYVAALTFLKSLTDIDFEKGAWLPDGMDISAKSIATASCNAAIKFPFQITDLSKNNEEL